MLKIIRVFPRRTSYTPTDDYSFVGEPPMVDFRPEADEVHISCTFTWDFPYAEHLFWAWAQHYPRVRIGGPAIVPDKGTFIPGMYVKDGVTFTTRGCDKFCAPCLVPGYEGPLRLLPITPGYIIQDNNLLQSPRSHIEQVFKMLRQQRFGARFTGGIDAALVDDWFVEQLRSIRVNRLFLAADTDASLLPLSKALHKLSFLGIEKLRCYVMLAHNGESQERGLARLMRVYELGAMPFAQLYQAPEYYTTYSPEWRKLANTWSRPAKVKAYLRSQH